MRKYKYIICSLCKEPKEENRSPYCKLCTNKYGKKYRLMKKLKPNINSIGLKAFIDKINEQKQWIDLRDMNTIIFFYDIITTNINEYDNFKFGKQVRLMWERIIQFYQKEFDNK